MALRIAPTPHPTPPRLCPDWPPNHQRAYFSPVARVSHDWAPTYPTALRTTPNEPRFLPTLPRRSHESCRISLIRGSAPDNFTLFIVVGASSRSAKNHQESSRLTTNLLRFTPNHPDSATTHPDSRFVAHSAPDSGMCNWGFTCGAYNKATLFICCLLYCCLCITQGAIQMRYKATRSPEISREQVQKLTPQFLLYIYIGYRFPLSLSTIWGNHLPVNFMFKFLHVYLRFGETTSPFNQ